MIKPRHWQELWCQRKSKTICINSRQAWGAAANSGPLAATVCNGVQRSTVSMALATLLCGPWFRTTGPPGPAVTATDHMSHMS